jgi:hypothetical protein
VVSALGNGLIVKGRRGPKIMATAVANLLRAMESTGVRRVAVMLSYGSGHTRSAASAAIRILGRTLLRKEFADLDAAATALATSRLRWTIGYFGALHDGPLTAHSTASESLTTPRRLRIARADVAHFLLDAIVNDVHVEQPVVLSGAAT